MFGFGFSEEEIIEALEQMPEDELDALINTFAKAKARHAINRLKGNPPKHTGGPPKVALPNIDIDIDTQPYKLKTCDCGASKVGGKHYDWCSSLSV